MFDRKRWCKDNKEKRKRYHKQYYKDHRQKEIRSSCGLSHENWLKMWENQDGKCLICGKDFTKRSVACIDHNHDTGKIRGLLCRNCNLGIGLLNDDPGLMAKAIKYLENKNKKGEKLL